VSVTRRDFLGTAATTAAGAALARPAAALPWITTTERTPPVAAAPRPVVVGSANGYEADARGTRGIQVAYDLLARGGDPLDAVIAGVNVVELNPEDQSVGLGGLPNEEGVVQLDASCMHGPTKRAGAVACLERIATPSLVAKAVMDHTDHVLLVGDDALRFARRMGFEERDLLTAKSREAWLRWKRNPPTPGMWVDTRPAAGTRTGARTGARFQPHHEVADDGALAATTGTINMNAVTAGGDVASVTTTSGMAWKIPGRVGDSPIIGAGQYCDNTVGAAGSTGRGEANIKVCGAFLAVEFMRQGLSPEAALLKVIERVIAMTEPRLLDARGRPYFDLDFYAIAKDGRVAGASAYQGSRYAVADAAGARLVDSAYLFRREERPAARPVPGAAPRR
jgi:N4-(beta-N-acetylglucosaminyl)-L-asparaginase